MATIAWPQPDPDRLRPGFELPNTQAILNAPNNYWTVNFNSGLALDDKTDLNLGSTYYQAGNYSDPNLVYISNGAGADEHAITTTVGAGSRKICARRGATAITTPPASRSAATTTTTPKWFTPASSIASDPPATAW